MKEIRLYIAELLLNLSLSIMPKSEEKNRLAELILNYCQFVNKVLKK